MAIFKASIAGFVTLIVDPSTFLIKSSFIFFLYLLQNEKTRFYHVARVDLTLEQPPVGDDLMLTLTLANKWGQVNLCMGYRIYDPYPTL